MRKLTKIELSYIAGIVDGEGSIMLSVLHKNTYPAPVVAVASNDRELLEWLRATVGSGAIVTKQPRKETHNISYDWKIRGNTALDLLAAIYPFLQIHRKKRRAKLLIDEYKMYTPRNGKYSDKMLQSKLDFIERFKIC